MDIEFTKHTWVEFKYWVENDPSKADEIKDLLKSIRQSPFHGLGKPEALNRVLRVSGRVKENQRCRNFSLSAVFTDALLRRIRHDRLVELYYDVIKLLEVPESREDFSNELFHHCLRII